MKKPLFIIGLLAATVFACNQQDQTINRLLSPGKLSSQLFSIDITKDTLLRTKKGALIRIPRGALSSASNTVQLEVKEAYSMQDILMAGLTTQSNGRPLSSGGMIYINAVGENPVKITQKISIATPTSFLDKNMQLFKGKVQSDSTINWTNPAPLPENPKQKALEAGKSIFTDNCASCHHISKDLTGPALAHIMKRSFPALYDTSVFGLDLFYAYIRNPAKVSAGEGYYRCLKEQFGGVMMIPFPSLTDTELNNLFAYIENESERRGLPVPVNAILKCRDSCLLYNEASSHWKEIKERLEKDSVSMVEDIRHYSTDTIRIDTTAALPELPPFNDDETSVDVATYIIPNSDKSLYYQFTIESFGWYNIDILMKDFAGAIPSELIVHMQGQNKERFSIYLIIPSIKVLAPGGMLDDTPNTYGFGKTDGTIDLPQNARAFIIAMGERGDSIIYARKEFRTREKQTIDLALTTITREDFQQQMAGLQLSNITIQAKDTKNAAELRKAIRELKNAEQLKPKNCNCDCFLKAPEAEPIDSMELTTVYDK
jgi:mono/diheme cytochrome c family protein